jgi:dephospho-CoA kinase
MIAERMKNRGDNIDWDDYKNRIESAKKEKLIINLADYVIDWTKSKEEILEEVKEIIKLKAG